MRTTPLLLLAYNRPDKVRRLIDRLREQRPTTIMVAVDGPKPGSPADEAKVQAVRDAVSEIDWTDDVETLFRPVNLGLRKAVAGAVSWAVEKHGEVIVLEEDVLPGDLFVPYATRMLERFRDDERIAHISGYNIVPPDQLSGTAGSRLTRYPESIAWATWARSWKHFDDSLEWGSHAPIAELARITGSRISALRWKQSFDDAAKNRIGTWAYRWIASMWSRGDLILSPNHNLVTYAGYDEGTNSVLKAPWEELPLFAGALAELDDAEIVVDPKAESWISRVVFGATALGVAKGFVVSRLLDVRKYMRARAR
ncbi:MAG: hypothetical protein JWR04_2137 [Rhodoglobus sp.]|nr:hypothetical protein [Rhodoglobus sp.]